MSRRKPKEEPELLMVSFCDIVTITTAAMFFAMLITVMEAVKVPVFKPTPRAKVTNKAPVFFECRNNQVFYIDKEGLDQEVKKLLDTLNPGTRSGDLAQFGKAVSGAEVGNEYYKVVPSYLLTAIMALEPKADAQGDAESKLADPGSKFQTVLRQLHHESQYVAFLVRDESFEAFRRARNVADKLNFDIGWELLGADEPIKFGAGGSVVTVQ